MKIFFLIIAIVILGIVNSIDIWSQTDLLDLTFDFDGMVATNFGGEENSIRSVELQSDGKIIVGGYSGSSLAVARNNIDGSVDNILV